MRYLRWIIVVLFLVSGVAAFGQQETKASIMKKSFGHIRAIMVRDACSIVEYDNQNVVNLISDTDVQSFHTKIRTDADATSRNTEWYLAYIIGDACDGVEAFAGDQLSDYRERIEKFRVQLYYAYTKYPKSYVLDTLFQNDSLKLMLKKRKISELNVQYTDSIKHLENECRCYNKCQEKNDFSEYKTCFPQGVFISLLETPTLGVRTGSGTSDGENGNSTKPAQQPIDQDSIAWAKCNTFAECIAYLNEHEDGNFRLKAEKKAWDLLCDNEQYQTKEDYETFMRALGNDITYKAEAKDKIKEFEQKDVLTQCVIWSDYEKALKQWPKDMNFINNVDEMCWVRLCKKGEEDEKEIYQTYLEVFKDYGGGNHKAEAKERIKDLTDYTYLWYLLIAIAAVALLLAIFLHNKHKKNHSQPVAELDNDATQREENATYERCTTVFACEYYLNTYPNGRFVKEVIAKKASLLEQMQKEEDTAFEKCTTITACEFYLIKYPKGKYVNEVKDKLAKLKENKEKPKPKPYPKQGEWVVVGASVKGNGHIQSNMPCQDNNKFELLGKGWGVAVVSDGAGSAAHSDMGSKVVVERGVVHFKNLIEKEGWIEKNILPSDAEWLQKSYFVLKTIRNEVEMVAKKNNVDVKSLSATCLAVVFSPMGLLVVHVGDGRMGCKTMSGEWKAIMTPHKGEEANQTLFLVSDFWSIPNYVQSGVLVPESLVVKEPVEAFALMSDGCESTAWLCTTQNVETGKYYDQNKPFEGFFNPLEETLVSFHKEQVPEEERKEKWYKFIESGTKGFVKEQDDKTMILGVFCGK